MNFRKRIWEIVEVAKPGDRVSRIFEILLLGIIVLNLFAVILGTIKPIEEQWSTFLNTFELVSIIIFTVEYVARLWSCTAAAKCSGGIRGRLRFAMRPMSIIDLMSILPFYLPFTGLDLRSLRALRLLRIVRIAKAGRYYSSLTTIKYAIRSKKEDLVLALSLLVVLLIVASTLLYYSEADAQPDTFSSIPAAMWWAVITITTVGYGDMYPVTVLGKCCTGIIAILGIGMFALPTAILGSGFLEATQQRKKEKKTCPHCGKDIT